MPICEECGKEFQAGDGAWDDGDYMCGDCIAGHIEKSERSEEQSRSDKHQPGTPPQSAPKK
jgi:hypothetical protein